MKALHKCLTFKNSEPRATANKIIVELMRSAAITLDLHVIIRNVALALCKEAGWSKQAAPHYP